MEGIVVRRVDLHWPGVCCIAHQRVHTGLALPTSKPLQIKGHLSNGPVIRYRHFEPPVWTTTAIIIILHFREHAIKWDVKGKANGIGNTCTKGSQRCWRGKPIWPGRYMGSANKDQMRRTMAIMRHWWRVVALRQGDHGLADRISDFLSLVVAFLQPRDKANPRMPRSHCYSPLQLSMAFDNRPVQLVYSMVGWWFFVALMTLLRIKLPTLGNGSYSTWVNVWKKAMFYVVILVALLPRHLRPKV